MLQILMYLGNVDASASTAKYNLKRGRSLLIFIGGEKVLVSIKFDVSFVIQFDVNIGAASYSTT